MSPIARRLQQAQRPGAAGNGKIVALYYPAYYRTANTVGQTAISELKWNSCTHIIDFSMGLDSGHLSAQWVPNGQGSLAGNNWSGSQATALCSAATAHGKIPILCVGNESTSDSWNANLDTSGKRSQIASDIADAMTSYGYKGVNLDGEPGGSITNYRLFWQAVLAEFTSRGWRTPGSGNYYSVSVACFGSETTLAKNAIADGCDWVVPMLYIPYETNTSRHITPLTGAGDPWDAYVTAWSTGTSAIPVQQIVPGMSYYAFSWSGASGPNQSATGMTGSQNWSVVNTAIGGVTAPNATWYSPAMMHGMVISGSWYSFESAASVQAKADWVVANGVGGTAIWMYQHGSLGGTNHPLADAVATSFGPLM